MQELMDKDEREEMDEGREDTGGAEPVKKRSRTLTTAHQTTVLNALLAKVSRDCAEMKEHLLILVPYCRRGSLRRSVGRKLASRLE